MQKLKSILKKSNKHKYAQILVENKVILTTRSDSSIRYCQNIYKNQVPKNLDKFKELIILYNDKKISYRTLEFLINKFERLKTSQDLYLNFITELSLESGLIKNKKKLSFLK